MREEQVTKTLLGWLLENGWQILCYDFPQSGTGRLLHPNGSDEKNKDAINPDIVAVKGRECLFFENKDRFYLPDFQKQNQLITHNQYTDAIAELLRGHPVETIRYGIGLPTQKFTRRAAAHQELVDFVVGIDPDFSVQVCFSARSPARLP